MALLISLSLFSPFLVNLAGGTALYLSTPRAAFLNGRFVYSNWNMELLERVQEKIVEEDLLKARIRYGDGLVDAGMVPPEEERQGEET